MRVRLKTLMAGPLGVFHTGAIIDVENAEELIAGGYAEPLERAVAVPLGRPSVAPVETPEPQPLAANTRTTQKR